MSESRAAPGPRVIVALDFPEPEPAAVLADRLDPRRCRLKVGNQLFTRTGPEFVERLHALGFDVFLDLKFHDIPNTVAGACRSAAALGVWMINVHAAGGRRMLESARNSLRDFRAPPLLIAVTLLTSLDEADLKATGVSGEPADQVTRLAKLAEDCDMDGVVCSPRELEVLAGVVSETFLRVTPGVRPAGTNPGDQTRIATPASAMADGASYLVIGRPITEAADPLAALEAIEAEISDE